jgi:hypothetical protein
VGVVGSLQREDADGDGADTKHTSIIESAVYSVPISEEILLGERKLRGGAHLALGVFA